MKNKNDAKITKMLSKQEVLNLFLCYRLNILTKYLRPRFEKLCFGDKTDTFNVMAKVTSCIKNQDLATFKTLCIKLCDRYVNKIDCSERQKCVLRSEIVSECLLGFEEVQKTNLAIDRINNSNNTISLIALNKSMKKAVALRDLSNEKNCFRNLWTEENNIMRSDNRKIKKLVNSIYSAVGDGVYDLSPIDTEKKVRKELDKLLKIIEKHKIQEKDYLF